MVTFPKSHIFIKYVKIQDKVYILFCLTKLKEVMKINKEKFDEIIQEFACTMNKLCENEK